jgi:hypothetical protein
VAASVFGPIVTGARVRHDVERTIRLFANDYLAEVSRQAGLSSPLVPFNSWTASNDLATFKEDHLPALIIISPGLVEAPTRDGASYMASWDIRIAVVLSSRDRESTKQFVELYVAAIRALVLQHQSLPYLDTALGKVVTGIADGIDWLDESYDEVDEQDSRTLGAGQISLAVQVSDVLNVHLGITEPSTDPTDLEPVQVTSADVEIRKAPL